MKLTAAHRVEIIPLSNKVHVNGTFAGLRSYTLDDLPMPEKVERWNASVIAAGHEGDGVALSAITGERIGQLITHQAVAEIVTWAFGSG